MAGLSLSKEQSDALDTFEGELLTITPNYISAWLHGKEALTDADKKQIDSCPCVKVKNQRLLKFARQDTVSFFLFLEALEKNDQKHLATRIYQHLLPGSGKRLSGSRRPSPRTALPGPQPDSSERQFKQKGPQPEHHEDPPTRLGFRVSRNGSSKLRERGLPISQRRRMQEVDIDAKIREGIQSAMGSVSPSGVRVEELKEVIRTVVQEEQAKQQSVDEERIGKIVSHQLAMRENCSSCRIS